MPPIHTCSFILRLWSTDQSRLTDWRASLEIPETGERLGFASLEQLFAYLIDVVENKTGVLQEPGNGPKNSHE